LQVISPRAQRRLGAYDQVQLCGGVDHHLGWFGLVVRIDILVMDDVVLANLKKGSKMEICVKTNVIGFLGGPQDALEHDRMRRLVGIRVNLDDVWVGF
jgi:hypothetical protein